MAFSSHKDVLNTILNALILVHPEAIGLLVFATRNWSGLLFSVFKIIQWFTHTLLVGMYNSTGTLKTFWQLLKKINMQIPCDPAVKCLGIPPREIKTYFTKSLYTNAHSSFIYNNLKLGKNPCMFQWVHIYIRDYSSAIKKEWMFEACSLDGSPGNYAECKKPVSQISYCKSPLTQQSWNDNIIEIENI